MHVKQKVQLGKIISMRINLFKYINQYIYLIQTDRYLRLNKYCVISSLIMFCLIPSIQLSASELVIEDSFDDGKWSEFWGIEKPFDYSISIVEDFFCFFTIAWVVENIWVTTSHLPS